MKTIGKLLLAIFIFCIFTAKSFAISAPTDFKVEYLGNNTVKSSWEPVEQAYMYYVQYGKESGINNGYSDITGLTEETTLNISGLELENTYYFSVIALDEDGNESTISNEVSTDILDFVEINNGNIDFILESATPVANNKIELKFSVELEDKIDSVRKFKIINKADSLDTFEVLLSELDSTDKSKLILTLDKDFVVGNEYEVVVINLNSALGNNIEFGIDSTQVFVLEKEITENSEVIIDTQIVDLNSASEENNTPSGEIVSLENMDKTTLTQASKTSDLPKTGAEHIIMFILALILGGLVFIFKFRKA